MREIIVTGYLVGLSILDGKERRVPIVLLGIGILIAITWVIGECIGDPCRWSRIMLGAVLGLVPGVFMLLTAYVTRKVGYGDGLALVGIGMLVGYKNCWSMLCISLMLMSFWGIGILVLRRGTRNTPMPYLPFLTMAYLICTFAKGG